MAPTLPSDNRGGNAMAPVNGFNNTRQGPAPAPVAAAPPTDWRQSWGKTEDAKVPTTTKPAENSTESYLPSAKSVLPQADSKHPDPLLQMPPQMPHQPNRSPVDEKPISMKSDPAVVPAAAVVSTTAAKPPATTVATPAQVYSPSASMPVPLGAQSVIQAGNPGPGGVRYIPVPMVTIPDVHRAPVAPMTNPAQAYRTPNFMTAGANANQTNAFAPAPARQSLVQATNAFGPGAPAVVNAPYGQSMVTPGSAGMMAHTMSPSGSYPAMNSSVVSAGFQGASLSSSVVPAAYHTPREFLAPRAHLGTVKPTAENIHQMEITLRDSLYPSQREWAAESMAAVDWRSHPQIVQALTMAAKEDPAPTVRASCVRCLATMKVNTPPVITVVRGLKTDSDPRVRQAAERASSILAAGEK
jgi:hypothetical protein